VNQIVIEEKSGIQSLHELRDEWRELFHHAQAEPFLSWEWAATWQRWIGQHKRVRILCARSGGSLIGLLPLSEETHGIINQASFLGSGYGGADYLDILALQGCQTIVTQAFVAYLCRTAKLDLLKLECVPSNSALLQALKKELSKTTKLRLQITPEYICPQIDLSFGWEAALKLSRRRDNFKRKLKHLKTRAGFEYRSITKPADAESAFERFRSLHDARWQDHGGSEATGHEALRSFHRELVMRLAETGRLHFDELWIEGRCIASIYGITQGKRFYFYNSGYDPALRNLSPGLVLLGLSIANACQRGIQRYDFLRGEEAYKFDWATSTRETVTVQVSKRKVSVAVFIAAKQAQSAAKDFLQTILPEDAINRLRGWIRERKRSQKLEVISQS